MSRDSIWRRSLGSCFVALGIGVVGASITGHAMAGCGMYSGAGSTPHSWSPQGAAAMMQSENGSQSTNDANDKDRGGKDKDKDGFSAGIVGMWKLTFISDGTAYPAQIPSGAVVDFGTSQWHADKTEFLISGGRAPSTGDVCMGVWQQTGRMSYKLKHVALAYISSDTPPPLGPAVPAAFVGPAIMRQTVTLGRSLNAFEGSFTIDQYAADETTLLQHIAGKVVATRFTVD